MKILLQHGNVRPTPGIENLVERRLLALADRVAIEEAVVRLADVREASPRYQVSVYLRVPGPDIHSTACDHTVRVTLEKAFDAVEAQIASRQGRRIQRRRRQPLLAAGGRAW